MTITVLGGGITEDEKLPKQSIKRLRKAIELFKKKKADRFLVCGKYSFLYGDKAPKTTEADLMKKFLLSKQIEEKKIFTEKKSMDTISNAYFAKTEYFLPEDEKEAIIVTSDYHVKRVKYIFEKIFGPEFNLGFTGVSANIKNKERLKQRQQKLLKEAKKMTREMKDGDHEFFKGKFFNMDYYRKKREQWIKNLTAKGDE